MKMNTIKSLALATVLVGLVSCNKQQVEKKSLENELDSVSYALGLDMAIKIKANWDKADVDLYQQGFRNGMSASNLLITADPKSVNQVLNPFFKKLQAEKRNAKLGETAAAAAVKFADVKKAGIDFLVENKKKAGVQTTTSGLQYLVMKQGTGEKPAGPTTKVKVHYHGTNLEGEVFDSSVDKGTPAEFGLNQVIKGWTEGVQLMNVGSKYKFFIPQELAYGAQQKGPNIKPFSTLIFEVELLDILK
jgi:FKBP-type peptidyl-prolyl cis-trans isomerase FkpA